MSPLATLFLNISTVVAQATTSPATQSTDMPPLLAMIWRFFPYVLLFVLLYLVLFRSKRKQDQKVRSMLDLIKKGDRVQTIGGIIGTVWEVRDTEVVLKVDETSNTKVKFTRKAIAHVFSDEVKDEKTKT